MVNLAVDGLTVDCGPGFPGPGPPGPGLNLPVDFYRYRFPESCGVNLASVDLAAAAMGQVEILDTYPVKWLIWLWMG